VSYRLYVSLQNDNRIRQFEMDPQSGALSPRGDFDAPGGPAPMTLNPAGDTLYVGFRGVSNGLHTGGDGLPREEFGLAGYAIDPRNGDLRLINRVQMPGEPSYVRTDRDGRFLLSSYFQAGHCAVHRLDADGAISAAPKSWNATNSGAHSIHIDHSNRYVFVPHIALGNGGLKRLPPGRQTPANAIFQFRLDPDTGTLTPNDPPRAGPPAGRHLGPRHAVFHPTQPWLYVCNEQSSSVTQYILDRATGTLCMGPDISNLPPQCAIGNNTTADIQIHRNGRFLYAPNRGHNTIAAYQVDPQSGALTSSGWFRADARPRAFMLDPTGHFLYCAGFETGRLTCYRINQDDGTLTELESVQAGRVPMWVLIAQIPGA
jgi:6-phosphogluconolactonase